MRQMLGLPATVWGGGAKTFAHQTLRDNVALLDAELLKASNARVAGAGREVFAKKGALRFILSRKQQDKNTTLMGVSFLLPA